MRLYVNTQFINSNIQPMPAITYEQRTNNIVQGSLNYQLSVDRWFLHKCQFPLFQIYDEDDMFIQIDGQKVDLTFPASTNNMYYDITIFVTAFNNALNTILSNLSLSSNDLLLSMNYETFIFSLESTQTFRNNYNSINVSSKIGTWLANFPSMNLNSNGSWTINIINNQNIVSQTSQCLENISPVCRISIESVNMPIVPELLPNNNPSNGSISNNSANIITDYKYFQADLSSIKSIVFNADGNHRFASLYKNITQFKEFGLSFFWHDYKNNKYPIMVLPNGVAEAKLMFKEMDDSENE